MTPIFHFFFAFKYLSQIRRILRWADFKSMEIIGKSASRKLFAKNCSEFHFASFFPYMFLLADLSQFSQQFRNRGKIVHCFDSHIQNLLRKRF